MKTILLLLTLALIGCSGGCIDDSGITHRLASIDCGWKPGGGGTMEILPAEGPGGCWYSSDATVALTPQSVSDPCLVDSARRTYWFEGEASKWWRETSDFSKEVPQFIWKSEGCEG